MPYRICKTIEIESGHQLSRHPDECRFPHGHSRRVEFVLEADTLDENSMVCDFKAIKSAVQDIAREFDHSLCLNTDDPMFPKLKEVYGDRVIGFPGLDPTTEVLAEKFFHIAKAHLEAESARPGAKYPVRPSVRLASVKVWETSSSWAEFSES